jgi:hypothetical protein
MDEDMDILIRLGRQRVMRNPESVDRFIQDPVILDRMRQNWQVLVENIVHNQVQETWVETVVDRLMMSFLLGCKRSGILTGNSRNIPVRDLIRTLKEIDAWHIPRQAWSATLTEIFEAYPDEGVVSAIVDMLVESYVTGCQQRPLNH